MKKTFKQNCLCCGKLFESSYTIKRYCSSNCKVKAYRRMKQDLTYIRYDKPTSIFIQNMHSYSEEEVNIAYYAFLNWKPLLKVVECHCNGEYVCYPHRLHYLKMIYNPKVTQNI